MTKEEQGVRSWVIKLRQALELVEGISYGVWARERSRWLTGSQVTGVRAWWRGELGV